MDTVEDVVNQSDHNFNNRRKKVEEITRRGWGEELLNKPRFFLPVRGGGKRKRRQGEEERRGKKEKAKRKALEDGLARDPTSADCHLGLRRISKRTTIWVSVIQRIQKQIPSSND